MNPPEETERSTDECVLVLAPTGRDAAVMRAVLQEARLDVEICAGMTDLSSALSRGAGVAVIAEEALTHEARCALADALAAQPAWSDFPLILLAGQGRGSRMSRRAFEDLGLSMNATVLERPIGKATLVSALRVALRSRRRQYELRAHLQERQEMEEQREDLLDQQRRIAETLQRSLLKAPRPDAFADLDVSTRYVPAWAEAMVGGDFYDVFSMQGQVALVVGDVVGKGLAAASHTAEIKYALRALVRQGLDPAAALAELNRYALAAEIHDPGDEPIIVSVLLAVLDRESGRVALSVAGAEPPVLIRRGQPPEAIVVNGVPIGVVDSAAYETVSATLNSTDALLLATDGITEARRGKEFFGMEGLVDAIERGPRDASLEVLGDFLIGEARAFSGGSFRDDVCLLLARWRRPPPKSKR